MATTALAADVLPIRFEVGQTSDEGVTQLRMIYWKYNGAVATRMETTEPITADDELEDVETAINSMIADANAEPA